MEDCVVRLYQAQRGSRVRVRGVVFVTPYSECVYEKHNLPPGIAVTARARCVFPSLSPVREVCCCYRCITSPRVVDAPLRDDGRTRTRTARARPSLPRGCKGCKPRCMEPANRAHFFFTLMEYNTTMPARRKSRSRSRSKSLRRVLKRRSSGKARRAAATRRSPERRTYSGTNGEHGVVKMSGIPLQRHAESKLLSDGTRYRSPLDTLVDALFDLTHVEMSAIYDGKIGYHIENMPNGVEVIHLRRYQQQAPTSTQLRVAPVQRFDAETELKKLYDAGTRNATLTLQNGTRKSVVIDQNYHQLQGYMGMKTEPDVDLRNIIAVSGVDESAPDDDEYTELTSLVAKHYENVSTIRDRSQYDTRQLPHPDVSGADVQRRVLAWNKENPSRTIVSKE